ncbi:TPA: FecCD family ABC transporter permease [Yersinia enterocolitica]|uniref:FecCD family ABC transporter permease n=1 Tax=Yersinia enterocolitica TaxID=630 RepID=UPI00370504DF
MKYWRDGLCNRIVFWLLIFVFLFIVVMIALCSGRYPLSINTVTAILFSTIFPSEALNILPQWTMTEQRVVLSIRLPRILIAALTGAGLSVAGASLQGIFRNPLVGPQIMGVSSGAALGGAIAIVLFSSLMLTTTFAFMGGLLAMILVYFIGRYGGNTQVLMLILAGVVVGAFFTALISLLTYFADPNSTLPTIVFWLMGSFATINYHKLLLVAFPVLFGILLLLLLRFRINVLSLGDETAAAMGVVVGKTRWWVLIAVTLITAATVAVAGSIGWVGLVVPHIARMIVGPDHRKLLPVATIFGAIYMIIIDTLARSATSAEIPLGVLTALIGAPVFIWLLRKKQDKGWNRD